MIFNAARRPRSQPVAPLAGYPRRLRPLIVWYDALSDWQRVQYAVAAMLFLLACGGYLLGLGSTMVLQRMEIESAALAAQPLPTEPAATPTVQTTVVVIAAAPTLAATPTAQPTRVPAQPTPRPTQTPFSGPVIAEPPAVPRQLPAAPQVIAPAAPVRATPTVDRPRNLETSKPEPPAASLATPTRGVLRTVQPTPPIAVRQPTAAGTPTSRSTVATTPLPTLALPATPYPTVPPTATAPPRPPNTPTVVKTPPVR